MGRRIFVADVQESVYMVRYKKHENQLIIFANDTYPRWITCTSILDYDTVATADKYGNIAIVRLPANTTDDVDEDPTGNKALWDRGMYLNCSSLLNLEIGRMYACRSVEWSVPESRYSFMLPCWWSCNMAAKGHSNSRRSRVSYLHHHLRICRSLGSIHIARRPRLLPAFRNAHAQWKSASLWTRPPFFQELLLSCEGKCLQKPPCLFFVAYQYCVYRMSLMATYVNSTILWNQQNRRVLQPI